MLCPNSEDVEQDLSDTYNALLNISGFAESCLSATVGRLDPTPAWLTDVDGVLADCRKVANRWLDARPEIVAPLVTSFLTYSSLMDAAAATFAASQSQAEDWEQFLTDLKEAARVNSAIAGGVREHVAEHHREFVGSHDKLRKILEEAREAQEEAHADVAAVSVKLQALYDRLAALNVGSTAAGMAGAQAVVKTVAQMSYTVLVEESAEIPYLGIAAMLFSIGDNLYDLIEGDAEIRSLLSDVAILLNRLAADAQVLAVTHALIAMLDDMNEAYEAAMTQVPRLNSYWDAEADKIDGVIDGLQAHGNPQEMMELRTVPKAAQVWQRLGNTASAMGIPTAVAPRVVELKIAVRRS